MASQNLISSDEILRHDKPSDCWIMVENEIWDVTNFVEKHPGGASGKRSDCTILYKQAMLTQSKNSHTEVCGPRRY